jgi:hypothetical protein
MANKNTGAGGTNWNDGEVLYAADLNDTNNSLNGYTLSTAGENITKGDFVYSVGDSVSQLMKKIYSTPFKTNLVSGAVTSNPINRATNIITLSSTTTVAAYQSGANIFLTAATHDVSGNVTAVSSELATGVAYPANEFIHGYSMSSSGLALLTCTASNNSNVIIRKFDVSGTGITAGASGVIGIRRTNDYYGWISLAKVDNSKFVCRYADSGTGISTAKFVRYSGTAWSEIGSADFSGSPRPNGRFCISMFDSYSGIYSWGSDGGAGDGISTFTTSGTTITNGGSVYVQLNSQFNQIYVYKNSNNDIYTVLTNNADAKLYVHDITTGSLLLGSITIFSGLQVFPQFMQTNVSGEILFSYLNSTSDITFQKIAFKNKSFVISDTFTDSTWDAASQRNGITYLSGNVYVAGFNSGANIIRPLSLGSFSATTKYEFVAAETLNAGSQGYFQTPFSIANHYSGLAVGVNYTLNSSTVLTPTSSSGNVVGVGIGSTAMRLFKV